METLAETYRDNPLQLRHIVPLDFQSHQSLLDTHVWSLPDETPDQYSSGVSSGVPSEDCSSNIPVIDLEDLNITRSVGHACQSWGIFQVVNHGIPLELLEGVESEARRLFTLPCQQKMKALRSPEGATGYGMSRIAQFFSKFMWHEGFTIMGSCVDHAKVLWPDDYRRFCDKMEQYQKKMKILSYRLLLIMLKSLALSDEEIKSAAGINESESGALQLNSYPSCSDPERALGLAPHTDSLLFTILHQSDTNGLQILRDGSRWVTVSPVTGALIVNVGDLLHILSNGKYPSVYHRAVVNQTHHRISIGYFYGLPVNSVVAPLLKDEKPLYQSMRVKEYLQIKAKNYNRALSMITVL